MLGFVTPPEVSKSFNNASKLTAQADANGQAT
jgi:hypothetical protein